MITSVVQLVMWAVLLLVMILLAVTLQILRRNRTGAEQNSLVVERQKQALETQQSIDQTLKAILKRLEAQCQK